MFAVIKMELSGKTVYGPVLKTTQLSARAQNQAVGKRAGHFEARFHGEGVVPRPMY